jgi:cysteine desulfurase
MNMSKDKIYLDHAATTPVDPEVLGAMKPYFTEIFGNAGSLHSFGRAAREAVDKSRQTIAAFIGCKPEELIFTSGGSASDNLAIRGTVLRNREHETGNNGHKPHVITSAIEHHAVLNTVKDLEKSGQIETTYIKPNAKGLIEVESVKAAVKENTVLVSIMYVNNEIGTIQPIREIGKMISLLNAERVTRNGSRLFFHTDAVQAIEYCKVDPQYLGVDLMTFTAHKIYGPKGIGALYVKAGTPLKSILTGGSQEFGFFAGTENTPGIVGFAEAVELVRRERGSNYGEKIAGLRDKLINGILKSVPNSILNGDKKNLSPAIANISFVNAEGESILLNLDFLGIAVSTGSACTSRTLEPSHVLTAMGIIPENAHGSIRFSLGRQTKEQDIDRVLEVLPGVIEKLRAMSPFK